MSSDPNCIFCKILRGEIGAVKLHEDADTLSFMDVMPQSPGHCLVIPKRHAANIHEISADEAAILIRATHRLAQAVKLALQPDGIGVYQFNGGAAGQTVFHIHFHVIPRTSGQDLALHARNMVDPASLQPIAAKITAALQS
ncbi:MAG TPA: HIT family protein [Alphaproteobacteria bacterium]|nr:histidine triad (HIT) family protein [Alphaproteobacteria bacterium]HEX4890345.1 HIT family protein [Alphaproteobacteria bacterium]